jgi:arylsulfatase A-like enzyme
MRVRIWAPTGLRLALFVQTVFLVALAATDGYDVAHRGEAIRVGFTYVMVVALFAGVHLIVGTRSRLSKGTTFTLFAIFVSVNFARFETAGSFDYGFAHENVRELMTPLGRSLVAGVVKPVEIVFLLVVPIALGAAALYRFPTPPWPWSLRSRRIGAAACLALIVGAPAARVSTHEIVTSFGASAVRFYANTKVAVAAEGVTRYPYVHDFRPSARAREIAGTDAPRPHVIMLLLESWSGHTTDSTRPDGRRYTPVFDAHRRDGLTFDHFYGNSVQSSRGRFALLCSLIPLYLGKEFIELADAPFHCLPHVLGEAGYKTWLYSASNEPLFEHQEVFFHHLGISETRFEDPAARGRDPLVWGAGLQDDVYYRRLFAALDEKVARAPNEPLFTVAINASNHYPFNGNPKHVQAPGFPTKYGRNYFASISAQDAWLTTFFEELDRRPAFRDAIVILVGDHSFPADEHRIHFNGLGAYEETFRTSFSLRWRGHVTPEVDRTRTVSQLDVAPTITDLLQLEHKSHFLGRSMLVPDQARAPSPMVQPYDGIRLVAVRYPYKLERHESAGQESLFDLSNDPDQEHDRSDDPSLASELVELRKTIDRIRENQALLRAKRVWPPSAP